MTRRFNASHPHDDVRQRLIDQIVSTMPIAEFRASDACRPGKDLATRGLALHSIRHVILRSLFIPPLYSLCAASSWPLVCIGSVCSALALRRKHPHIRTLDTLGP
jgi:hypothetical protein